MNDGFDVRYLKELFDDLSESNKEQAKALVGLGNHVASMNVILESISEKVDDHKQKLEEHAFRIRDVERKHDSCDAASQMKGLWYHVKRLNAFKDMVKDRSREDSAVIDVHAMRMEREAEKNREAKTKEVILKYAPWAIVVFVVGVALATIVTMKFLSGESIDGLPGVHVLNSAGKASTK